MKNYIGVLLVNISLAFIIYNTIGMYSEDISEIYQSALHNSLLLSQPEPVYNNCNVFFLLTYPIVCLKKIFPTHNIHGYFLILMTCIFMTNYFVLLREVVLRQSFIMRKRKFSILLFLLILILLFNDIFTVQYTRIAIHLIASGILLYNMSASLAIRITAFCCVVTGLLLRFEGFVIIVPLLLIFFIFHLGKVQWMYIAGLLKRNVIFVVIFLCIIILTNFSYTKLDKQYEPYRAIIYALADFQTGNAHLKLRNKQDSVKFDMAQYYFFNDLDSLGVEDMYQLGIKPIDREPLDALSNFDIRFRVQTGIRAFADFLDINRWLIFAGILGILVLAIAGGVDLWRTGNIFAGTILLILLTAVYIKIEQRVSVPLLGFAFLLTVLSVLNSISGEKNQLFPALIFVAGVFLLTNAGVNYPLYKSRIYTEKQIVKMDTYFKRHPEIKVVYWDTYLYSLFLNKVASRSDLYNPARDYTYDNSLISLFDGYQQRMEDRFGTTKFIGLIRQAVNDKGTVFFSTDEKMRLHMEYLKYQYGQDIKAVKLSTDPFYISKFNNYPIEFYLYYLVK